MNVQLRGTVLSNREARPPASSIRRRDALKAFAGFGLWLPVVGRSAEPDPDAIFAAPQENDLFVFAFGEMEGEVISPGLVTLNSPPIIAYPMDPKTGTVRDGSRLNQILLVRLDPTQLSEDSRLQSADSIVAYSAVCTHTGCDITGWDDHSRRFKCPCHDSEFDPADGAKVIGGPAPWQLASLPLKIADGALVAAGTFVGRVGFQQPGTNPFAF